MNRERCKELLPVIQAFAEGKKIQFRCNDTQSWSDYPDGDAVWADSSQYRIKPKPLERWISISDDGSLLCIWREKPNGQAISDGSRVVHMREVTDE